MELETKLVEHMEQKVEEIPADDILRVEVLEFLENLRLACGMLWKGIAMGGGCPMSSWRSFLLDFHPKRFRLVHPIWSW